MSNIKEQIRQEVERQRSFIEGLFIDGDNSFYEGQDDAYNHLLAFIDSLPDEKPSEDLEEAAESYEEEQLSDYGYRGEWSGAFIAGAEWALNQGVKATGVISPRGIIYDNNIGHRLFLERYHNGDKVEVQIRKIEGNGK